MGLKKWGVVIPFRSVSFFLKSCSAGARGVFRSTGTTVFPKPPGWRGEVEPADRGDKMAVPGEKRKMFPRKQLEHPTVEHPRTRMMNSRPMVVAGKQVHATCPPYVLHLEPQWPLNMVSPQQKACTWALAYVQCRLLDRLFVHYTMFIHFWKGTTIHYATQSFGMPERWFSENYQFII